jgi:myo-inositol-1(or 4)-monophosphatase
MPDLLLEIAKAVRSAVLPHLGSHAHRTSESTSPGGDPTFGIDEIAEDAANKVLEEASGSAGLAWYTEDRGLVERGDPKQLLVIDPIDGTRPAGAGLETCMVSIAAAPWSRDATLGDVDEALLLGIKDGALFRARRGAGVRIVERGETREPRTSGRTSLDGAFFTYGLRGRPTVPSAIVLEELIDGSGVKGGTFDLGSATFGMSAVITGRLDAYVDQGQRMIDDVPETRALFEAIADGAVLNNNPYDVAAAKLICEEAGCPVTDAAGRALDGRPLVGSGADYCVSTVVSATPELHAEIIATLDRGIEKLRTWMSERGDRGSPPAERERG